MQFESFSQAENFLLWSSFIIALILGASVNKTNFCTMGAISDMVNMDSYSRFRSWLFAIAIAVFSVTVLEYFLMLDTSNSFPPYRGSTIIIGENILGGILFGIGMTFASGCGNKTLVRLGSGNLKSLVVIFVIMLIAYFMTNPFPDSDKTLYSTLFYDWLRPISITVEGSSDIGALISNENTKITRLVIGLIATFALLLYIFKSAEFRSNTSNIAGGLMVGIAVVCAWWITSNITLNIDDEIVSLNGYYEEWDMLADSDEGKPAQGRPLSVQSFTFINPIGQGYGYIKSGFDRALVTFGLVSVLGVILGSFLLSIFTKSLRIEWFADLKDFFNHLLGATLMGFGGVLALGCTVGQGITGFSTLAVGSILTFVSIIFGSALTMKAQYYRLVYEDASIYAAIISSLADMHLLPNAFRKLDAD